MTSDLAANSGEGEDALLAAKLAVAWQPTDHVELYADFGDSFHSNTMLGQP